MVLLSQLPKFASIDFFDMNIFNPEQALERSFLQKHNMQTGDQITFDCGFYNHVVVVLGTFNGKVHITENQKFVGVQHIPLGKLLAEYKGRPAFVKRNHLNVWNQQNLVNSALQQTGKAYHLLNHNCEHYANRLVNGEVKSGQIQAAFGVAAFLLLVVAIVKS